MTEKGGRVLLLFLAFCFFVRVPADGHSVTQSAQETRTWALVVGISRYPKLPGGLQLQFADRDALSFAESLKKAGVPHENIRAITGQEASSSAIRSALGNWLARAARAADTVYIFFSGHGFVEKDFGESYFLVHDSDLKDPYSTAISLTEISNALRGRVRARQVTIIADSIRRDLFPPDGDGPSNADLFARSLSQISQSRPGFSAVLANSPGEFSREGQRWGGLGVFTKFLVDALAGSADINTDGAITTGEMFDFVSAKVSEDTANRQRPWKTDGFVVSAVIGRSQSVAGITNPVPASGQRPQEPLTSTPQARTPQTVRPDAPSPQPAQRQSEIPKNEASARSEPLPPKSDSTRPVDRTSQPAAPEPRKDETVTSSASKRGETSPPRPRSEERVAANPAPSQPKPVSPPARGKVEPADTASERTTPTESAKIETSTLPPPPKPEVVPPSTKSVSANTPAGQPSPATTSLPTTTAGTAPSPLILQLEAAISAGNLIEPARASAWDLYQRLAQDQTATLDATRIRPRLADAMEKSGIAILRNGALSDKVTDRVDDFRRAGQIFARARSLAPEKADLVNFEKLSAAQALVALQFFDEAERSLTQLRDVRSAEIENAWGMIYQGKFDNWRAERAFKRATEIDPQWYAPHYNLGLLYRSQGNEAALETLGRAAELGKDNVIILTTFGDECMSRNQWQPAIDAFRKAVEQSPDDDGLRTKLGNALYSAGLRDEANREYQKASELRRKR